MNIKYRLSAVICFISVLFISFSMNVFAEDGIPQTSAASFVLLDGDTGEIILSKNERKRLPMASTTKIMTAICIIENSDLDEIISIPKEACGIEGSSMYLFAGERISIRDLLFGLMLDSANDAAVALALHQSGEPAKFCDLMNDTAQRIGMADSHFANANGLGTKGHFSSAYDLALLMKYAMKNRDFAEITATKKAFLSVNGEKKQVAVNHNKLLSNYEYCIGGKTGFTKEAGRCLVTISEKDGKKLICATLSDPDDWRDHTALFEYGFSLFEKKLLFEKGELKRDIPVAGGISDKATVSNLEKIELYIRGGDEITVSWEAPHFLYAKVIGADIGEDPESASELLPIAKCRIYQRGYLLAECELFAEKTVERYENKGIMKRIKVFFEALWERLWKK